MTANTPDMVAHRYGLLSCPFCGGSAEMRSWDWPYERWQVRCSVCKAHARARMAKEAEAGAAWNTRASSPPGDEGHTLAGELERLTHIGASLLRAFAHGLNVDPETVQNGSEAFVKSMREHNSAALRTSVPASEGQVEAVADDALVERAAKALWSVEYPGGTSWDDWARNVERNPGGFDGRDRSRTLARAALATLPAQQGWREGVEAAAKVAERTAIFLVSNHKRHPISIAAAIRALSAAPEGDEDHE